MSTKKKLLEAAAGNAAGDGAIYVDDVFSTDLWAGDDAEPRGIQNGIALGDFGYGTSTRFNGTSDYLSRSSDLTGNADGKTLTFSCWVFLPAARDSNQRVLYATDSSDNGVLFNVDQSNYLGLEAWNGGVRTLQGTTTTKIGTNVWTHILVSMDMANSSNRHVYLNDVAASVTWSTYNNANIEFTRPTHYIGVWGNGTARHFYDDMAHFYLDYTYRNLSTESNRRIFIDANGGSTSASSLAALNPIMYLPMTTAYAVGKNAGTGGDFTANGSPTIVENGTEYISGEGKGGLVWIKVRTASTNNDNHVWYSTDIGGSAGYLRASTTDSLVATGGQQPLEFNSNGFTMPVKSYFDRLNDNGYNFASWTFRKQPGFFDVVTYTGNGTAGRTVSHNLGSVPGFMVVKKLNSTSDFTTYHRSMGATKYAPLNDTDAYNTGTAIWNSTEPTATEFTVGDNTRMNNSGDTYVAYLFAHDAQDFGTDSDESIIKCGSVSYTSGTPVYVDLGWEAQWVLIKQSNGTESWYLVDTMRGMIDGDGAYLQPNTSNSEGPYGIAGATSNGFVFDPGTTIFGSGTFIYVAIRRPHKPASEFAATDLFAIDTRSASNPGFTSGFPVDFQIYKSTSGSDGYLTNRLTGNKSLLANSTAAEGTLVSDGNGDFDYNTGWMDSTANISTLYSWMWRRAPGFFDVVAYEGNQTARQIAHNLGAVPEMMWVKCRSQVRNWAVYHASEGNTKVANLNSTGAFTADTSSWNNTSPTSTHFTVGDGATTNFNPEPMIAYLFASVPGISKVGSYTGTGASLDIDCGFTNGARLVLLKRTDTNGNWFLWDTARGIVAGNDPYLLLNETSAESTGNDYIDPYSAGFNLTGGGSSINGAGGSFIFLAIA